MQRMVLREDKNGNQKFNIYHKEKSGSNYDNKAERNKFDWFA